LISSMIPRRARGIDLASRDGLVNSFFQDLRYGLRGILRAPGFATVAVITLAIAIGANTAMFSVINTLLLHPLPYRDPSRIVALQQSNPAIAGLEVTGVSPLEYLDYRARTHAFSALGGVIVDDMNLAGGAEPQRVKTGRITPSAFDVLGVQPILGRTFTENEDHYGGPRVVILSYTLWQQNFGGEKGILGRTLELDKMPYTVIGVMPASFKFPYDGMADYEPAALWIPMDFTPRDMQNRADGYDVEAFARIKPGTTLAQAQQDAEAARRALQADHSDVYTGKLRPFARVTPMPQVAVAGIRSLLLILFGAVGFVLLIACVNIANLLLVRAAGREREIAMRTALGASSGRIVRQLITECLLLSAIGGAAGLGVAYAAIRLIARMASSQLRRLAELSLDPAALIFTFAVAVITGLLFGLAPALRALRINIYGAIKSNSQQGGSAPGRFRWNNGLVVLETAATLILLLGAGLLLNSFVRVLRVSPGIDPDNVLIVRTAFDSATYPTAAARNISKTRMLDRLAAISGVKLVGATSQLPLADERSIGVHVDGEAENEFHMISNELVSPSYFQAMGISLLGGRSFTDLDRPDTPGAAVVSESFARKFWPGEDALGKRLSWAGRWPFTVVGVVADVRLSALDSAPPPTIYMDMLQTEGGRSARTVFAIRTSADPRGLIPEVRRAVWSVDGSLPVYDVTSMNSVVAESLARRRFMMLLLAAFAGIALILAAVGLYGVLSYSVAQRTREMGLRIALGATPRQVRRLVLRGGMALIGMGIALGLMGGLLATRLMSQMLFGIDAIDPLTYAGVAALLAGVAWAASSIPAHRATRVDPIEVLRHD
jgi:predicted permease